MSRMGIIGILDTDTKKDIKRKYSKVIKEAYAADDHELIMKIQNEYKRAMKGLKKIAIKDVEEKEDDIKQSIDEIPKKDDYYTTKVNSLEDKIEEVYWDRKKRFNKDAWGELFNSMPLKEETEFNDILKELVESKYILPRKIKDFMGDRISWEKDGSLREKVLDCLDEEQLFDEISIEDIKELDEYLKRRKFIIDLYLKGYYSEALENIIKVSDEFKISENIILMIQGLCLYYLEKYEDSMRCFEKLVIEKDSNNMARAYYLRSHNEGGSSEVIQDGFKKTSYDEKLVYKVKEAWKKDFKQFYRRTWSFEKFLLKNHYYRMYSLWRGLVFSAKAIMIIGIIAFILKGIMGVIKYLMIKHTGIVVIVLVGLVAWTIERKTSKNERKK